MGLDIGILYSEYPFRISANWAASNSDHLFSSSFLKTQRRGGRRDEYKADRIILWELCDSTLSFLSLPPFGGRLIDISIVARIFDGELILCFRNLCVRQGCVAKNYVELQLSVQNPTGKNSKA